MLKKIIVIILFVLFCVAAVHAETVDDKVRGISGIASAVMGARQSGVPRIISMNLAAATKERGLRVITTAITIDAYRQPVIPEGERRDAAIAAFADKWGLVMFKALTHDY